MENQIFNQMLEWAKANHNIDPNDLSVYQHENGSITIEYLHDLIDRTIPAEERDNRFEYFCANVVMDYDPRGQLDENCKFSIEVSPVIDGCCYKGAHAYEEYETIEEMFEDIPGKQDIDPWDYEEFFDSDEDEDEE